MYKPKERTKHKLPLAAIPSPAEAEASALFSPIRLPSGLELATRTWVPAMVPWRATEDGFVTEHVLDWYARFAQGKPGAIVVEATGIRDVPSGPLLRIGHDRFVPGLADLVRVVREASGGATKLMIQIIDFLRVRRRPDPRKFFQGFLSIREGHRAHLAATTGDPSWHDADEARVRAQLATLDELALVAALSERELEALRFGARERVTDLDLEHVRTLPAVLPPLFADASRRAREAGFDGVELHYAHAYTMASFLSRTNTRTDGYGTTLEGRLRLPLEVIAAVRAEVGPRFTVGLRFLCDEIVAGGSRVEDAEHFGVAFAGAGVDFLSLSTGGKFDDAKQPKVGEAAYPYTGESGFECMPTVISDARGPFARNVAKQARVRSAVRAAGHATPVVVAGGIAEFSMAEGILHRGEGDIVASARQSLADPDWWHKLRVGHGDQIRRCSFTNYCEALDQKHKVVTCQLWDLVDLDAPGVKRTPEGRRRTIAPPWSPT